MRRYSQTFHEITSRLSLVESDWQDDFSREVIKWLDRFPERPDYELADIQAFLEDADRNGAFSEALTIIRLFLGLSKDEFIGDLKRAIGGGGVGVKRFRSDRQEFMAALEALGLSTAVQAIVTTPLTWRDLLAERLRGGRGSAIKGQTRGRAFEDFVEVVVRKVFGERGYDVRCRFVGESGTSTEKADFVIPSRDDAQILIEAKAYGATGSKQSDVLGDISRIVEQKRHDAHFLVLTDGLTWRARANDLRKIIGLQNRGRIMRIYTKAMVDEFEQDLCTLKDELQL